jgi:hypothetical protein
MVRGYLFGQPSFYPLSETSVQRELVVRFTESFPPHPFLRSRCRAEVDSGTRRRGRDYSISEAARLEND